MFRQDRYGASKSPRAGGTVRSGEAGQAAVELVVAIPFLLAGLAVAVQLALVGFTAWTTAGAARAAARADYVGADPAAGARAALPPRLADAAEVESVAGTVEVEVAIPRLLPLLPRLTLSSSTRLGPAGGTAAVAGPGSGR